MHSCNVGSKSTVCGHQTSVRRSALPKDTTNAPRDAASIEVRIRVNAAKLFKRCGLIHSVPDQLAGSYEKENQRFWSTQDRSSLPRRRLILDSSASDTVRSLGEVSA